MLGSKDQRLGSMGYNPSISIPILSNFKVILTFFGISKLVHSKGRVFQPQKPAGHCRQSRDGRGARRDGASL